MDSTPPDSAKQVPPRRRSPRFRRALALFVLVLAVAAWFTRYRGTGWSDTINPVSWYHRLRGDDLYNADETILARGNRSLPEVALTFDDGPHTASRGQILDTLKQFGDPATFFDVGKNMDTRPDLVRRTLAEGHEIANHSDTHQRLDSLSARDRHREINDADTKFFAITGGHLNLMRPPGMRYNDAVLAESRRLGYIVVSYTTASHDFILDESPEVIASRNVRSLQYGSILLLHDYPGTAAALPAILRAIRERGLRCVTISQMIAHLPEKSKLEAQRQLQSASSQDRASL